MLRAGSRSHAGRLEGWTGASSLSQPPGRPLPASSEDRGSRRSRPSPRRAGGKGAAGPPQGSVLPYPDPEFRGVIGRTTADSKPDFPQPVSAPEGAPNVLLILTDDVGFGASSTFGGPIPTPTLDALAANGLKYNAFNTTALCSPTRAALITGRDQHNAAYRHHHGAQPRLSRLRLADAEERRHGRRDPARQRLQHRLVRQEPQRARLAEQRRRPVRPVADRTRLRLFLRLHRRRREPVGSDAVREHDARSSPRRS